MPHEWLGDGSFLMLNQRFQWWGPLKQRLLKKGRVVKNGGRPVTEMNLVLDALFYRLRNCGPWRDMPPQYGPWQTIYG